MSCPSRLRDAVPLLAAIFLALPQVAAADADETQASTLAFSGDARFLFSSVDDESDEGSMRIRAGFTWDINPGMSAVMRAATSASSHGNEWRAGAFPGAQTGSGLAPGSATLDLAHLQFTAESGLRLRIGRFQETLALPAVPDKSLDRKDSDSTGISYSDGVSAEHPIGRGWSLLGILQYQPEEGATNRPREPLSFEDDGSRASGFFALRRTDDAGPWALASLSYSAYPDSLAEAGHRTTYSGFVANAMRRIPAAELGQLLIGGSLAYAPEIPQSATASQDSHLAWQVTANLVDFGPHDQGFGVVYMRTGAGWLLSPDLANGRWLAEARYRIKPMPRLTCELRLRYRRDLEDPVSGTSGDIERDWYLRFTWRT